MFKWLTKFKQNQEGNVIEWIIILALIGILVDSIFPGFRMKLMEWYQEDVVVVNEGIGMTETVTPGSFVPIEDAEIELESELFVFSSKKFYNTYTVGDTTVHQYPKGTLLSFSSTGWNGTGVYSCEWENYNGKADCSRGEYFEFPASDTEYSVRVVTTDDKTGKNAASTYRFQIKDGAAISDIHFYQGPDVLFDYYTYNEMSLGVDIVGNVGSDYTCSYSFNNDTLNILYSDVTSCDGSINPSYEFSNEQILDVSVTVTDNVTETTDVYNKSFEIIHSPINAYDLVNNLGRASIYNGENVQFKVNAIGGSGSYNVEWSNYSNGSSSIREYGGETSYSSDRIIQAKVCDSNIPLHCDTETFTLFIEPSVFDFAYLATYQTWTAPRTGYYKIETWGAQGGYSHVNSFTNHNPGKGGYSKGVIYLTSGTQLYLYVGGAGNSVSNSNPEVGGTGGWNGGGDGGDDIGDGVGAASGGGGATDIRLSSGSWDDPDSLKSRIIVAGGGGGSGSASGCDAESEWGTDCSGNGGNGGGLTAEPGESAGVAVGGQPGSQASGYDFGIGGSSNNSGTPAGGGGGGFYGGYNGISRSGHGGSAGGGGGSSFISGHYNADAVNESGYHTRQPNHYSGLIFSATEMQEGVNVGNGKAKITMIFN